MEEDRKHALKRGFWYSSFSGVIVSVGVALYFLLSSHAEWEALGAGMLAGAFLVVGPIIGFCLSVILAGVVYVPLYSVSRRVTGRPTVLLPISGAIVGLMTAFVVSMWIENLIFPVYLILAFWGVLGGSLFVFGAEYRKAGWHAHKDN